MIYFSKFFKFPGPKDLGWSDSNNAMPSRLFPNNKTEKNWEDYYEYLNKTYPVKFFLASIVPQFFRDIWMRLSRPFKDAHYWLVSHTIRQYHWLDLRQPKRWKDDVEDYFTYRYGWVDTDHQMEYAMMNLLVNYVEQEMPGSYFIPSEEEAAKDDGVDYNYSGFKRQLANHKEYMAIYNWWKTDRFVELAEYDRKLTEWSDARHAWADNADELLKEVGALEARNDAKLDEMLIRLIKIRRCLWT
jgi:hypothetical protein